MALNTGPLHYRLMADIKDLIVAMQLSKLTGGDPNAPGSIYEQTGDVKNNVYVQMLGEKVHPNMPAVIITEQGLLEEELLAEVGTFEEDWVMYPVLIAVCDKSKTNLHRAFPTYLSWRHDIAQKLRGLVYDLILPSCPELCTIYIREMPIFEPDAHELPQMVSAIVALCWTHETRLRNVV